LGKAGQKMNEVYIIIPVYRGLKETAECLRSVSKYSGGRRVVVIEDQSPDAEMGPFLKSFVREHPHFELLENPVNLGFVKTANLGFQLYPQEDVILLNNDTIVTPNWVEKLRAWACADINVATVTPFSNNATICSYPKMNEENELPDHLTPEEVNALFEDLSARGAREFVELPTGIGSCMYIMRRFLEKAGGFNEELYGKGYGEENDFCLRCSQQGGRHLIALDTFIYHKEATSFGSEERVNRTKDALKKINELYPGYDTGVMAFIESDPIWSTRCRADLLRYMRHPEQGVLFIDHGLGGGTSRHVRDLSKLFVQKGWRPFILEPWKERGIRLKAGDPAEAFSLTIDAAGWINPLLDLLKALNVKHLHYHHVQGYASDIFRLPAKSGLEFDFTFHDYYMICPRVTGFIEERNYYCGFEIDPEGTPCQKCSADHGGIDIENWRSIHHKFLKMARKLLSPSREAARIINGFFPGLDVEIQPHPECYSFRGKPRDGESSGLLNVGLIGGLSPQKGRKVLQECLRISRERALPIRWVLMGVTDQEGERQDPDFVITGRYEVADLPQLFEKYEIDVVVIPALWPETYSYILSESWLLGRPVIAPAIGAFKERMEALGAGILLPCPISSHGILDALLALKGDQERLKALSELAGMYHGRDPGDFWGAVYGPLPQHERQGEKAKPVFLSPDFAFSALERLVFLDHKKRGGDVCNSLRKELTLAHNHAISLSQVNDTLQNQVNFLNQVIRKHKVHWIIALKTAMKGLLRKGMSGQTS
jgi:GT2 family glycosyltransferase/glycosyltransferase involved in cell wall biosynthesis